MVKIALEMRAISDSFEIYTINTLIAHSFFWAAQPKQKKIKNYFSPDIVEVATFHA